MSSLLQLAMFVSILKKLQVKTSFKFNLRTTAFCQVSVEGLDSRLSKYIWLIFQSFVQIGISKLWDLKLFTSWVISLKLLIKGRDLLKCYTLFFESILKLRTLVYTLIRVGLRRRWGGLLGRGEVRPGERDGVRSDHTRDTCWSATSHHITVTTHIYSFLHFDILYEIQKNFSPCKKQSSFD